MIRLTILILYFTSMCIATIIDTTNSSKGDNTSMPQKNETDHSIRLVFCRGDKAIFRNLNSLEISYLGIFSTKYDYPFLSSLGFMQEYGYSYSTWSDEDLLPYLYGKIGVEAGIYNNLYFDFYLGITRVFWPPIPTSGLRSRYTISIHQYIKIDVGGSLDFMMDKKIYHIYVGFIFF